MIVDMKKLVKNFTILVGILAVLVSAINRLYIHNTVNCGTMSKCKNDKAYIENVPEGIDICNFGDSQGYYGFNYDDYIDDYTCFNFSLPSQSMTYNYRILKNYQNNIKSDATVYINISYVSCWGRREESASDFQSKNQRYYRFLQKEYIKGYDAGTDFLVNYLPALAVSPQTLIRTVTNMEGGGGGVNTWDHVTCETNAITHGMARYRSHVAGNVNEDGTRIINKEEISAVYDMIELCRKIGAEPVLITTPYLAEYIEAVKKNDPKFYDDYYGVINDIVKNTDVRYYDYQCDDRFVSRYDLFFNTDHLNRDGAKKFTSVLLQETLE